VIGAPRMRQKSAALCCAEAFISALWDICCDGIAGRSTNALGEATNLHRNFPLQTVPLQEQQFSRKSGESPIRKFSVNNFQNISDSISQLPRKSL
jgi:hypothetical protein